MVEIILPQFVVFSFMLLLELNCHNIAPMHPNVVHRDTIDFAFPPDTHTAMAIFNLHLISFIAISGWFCVFHVHCWFRCNISIESVPSHSDWCIVWCVEGWVCTIWRWRLARVQDRYWSWVRNVYVVWYRFDALYICKSHPCWNLTSDRTDCLTTFWRKISCCYLRSKRTIELSNEQRFRTKWLEFKRFE